MSLGHTAANYQGKEVGAADAEDAADGCTDQPLQAHRAKLPFEQNDSHPDRRPDQSILRPSQPERFNKVAGNRNNYDKKKTYQYQIHRMTLPRMQLQYPGSHASVPVPHPPQM